jgi:hypothetical protein
MVMEETTEQNILNSLRKVIKVLYVKHSAWDMLGNYSSLKRKKGSY